MHTYLATKTYSTNLTMVQWLHLFIHKMDGQMADGQIYFRYAYSIFFVCISSRTHAAALFVKKGFI